MAITVTDTGSYGYSGTFAITRTYSNGKTTFSIDYSATGYNQADPYAIRVYEGSYPNVYTHYQNLVFNVYIGAPGGTKTKYSFTGDVLKTSAKKTGVYYYYHVYYTQATCTFTISGKSFELYFECSNGSSSIWGPDNANKISNTITLNSYEEADIATITLSGAFSSNNLKAVTKIAPVLTTDTAEVVYTIGSKSETNASAKGTITKSFDSSWYAGLPSATSGTLTVKATIKRGSAVWFTLTKTLAVTIPDSVKPSISALTVADRLGKVPSSWGIYVQNYSAVKINTLTYAAGTGSSVTKISLKVGSMVAKDGTPSKWPVGDTITSSGTLTVTVTVTDARGRTASRSVSISVAAYNPPNFNSAISERCDAQMVLDEEGNRFKTTTSVAYSSCNGKNSITLTLESRVSTESAYSNAQTITPNATVLADRVISPDAAYNVRLTLRDQFNTAYHYDYVSTALYLIHFHNGGTGIAFGQKASSNDSFEVNFDAVFHKETMFTATDGHTVTIQQIIDALGL